MPHQGSIVEVGHDESPENGHSSILVGVSRKALTVVRRVGMLPCDTVPLFVC